MPKTPSIKKPMSWDWREQKDYQYLCSKMREPGDAEIETVITSLGSEPRSGLVVLGDAFTEVHHGFITSLVVRNNVPAVYPNAGWARDGGLLSYGPDFADSFRRSASYVDRILRGGRPDDLPVQLPIKFELVLNASQTYLKF
jgi:putative ABC transport system substrate-binding protein